MKDKKLDKNKIKNNLKNNDSSGTNGMHNNDNDNNNNNTAIPLLKNIICLLVSPEERSLMKILVGIRKVKTNYSMVHNRPNNENNNIKNNNDNNINGPLDSWGNSSSAPYQNGNTTASFTMAAFSGDGSSPELERQSVFPKTIGSNIMDISSSPG